MSHIGEKPRYSNYIIFYLSCQLLQVYLQFIFNSLKANKKNAFPTIGKACPQKIEMTLDRGS